MQPIHVLVASAGTAAAATKTEAKTQALSWLASQLRWERTLDELRTEGSDHETERKAA